MYSLDRLENNKAVLIDEHSQSIIIDASLLPIEVKEGDILIMQEGRLAIDNALTKQKQEEMRQKLKKIINKK